MTYPTEIDPWRQCRAGVHEDYQKHGIGDSVTKCVTTLVTQCMRETSHLHLDLTSCTQRLESPQAKVSNTLVKKTMPDTKCVRCDSR